jgi:flagellar M-ring protein FliF
VDPRSWLSSLNGKNLLLPAFVLAILAGGAMLALELRGPRYLPLFTDLEARDAAEVVRKLEEMKVPYRLADGGRTVLVPEPQLYKARLEVAASGLPRQGVVGLEGMEKGSFGATDFERKVGYLRALQGELTRTILEIEGVEAARVHLNLPEESVFVRERKEPSAAVLLQMRPGATLDASQVRGIAHLVAASVEGLSPERVTVVDSQGRLLSSARRGDLGGLDEESAFEERLARSLEDMLSQVFGQGNVVVRVRAQLSFDRQTVERELFQPQSGEQGVLRQSETVTETTYGSAPAGGIPGTESNLGSPSYVLSPVGGGSSYSREERRQQFEISRIRETVQVAPGTIKKLSVSVLVNKPLSEAEREGIAQVVRAAVGYDAARGDEVTVASFAFARPAAEGLLRKEDLPRGTSRTPLWSYAALGLGGLAVLASLLWALRGRRYLVRERERMAAELARLEQSLKARASAPPKESRIPEAQAEVTALARQKPEEVAEIIRSWLSEE